eukprot:6621488-Prymnesium_polylepis.2
MQHVCCADPCVYQLERAVDAMSAYGLSSPPVQVEAGAAAPPGRRDPPRFCAAWPSAWLAPYGAPTRPA